MEYTYFGALPWNKVLLQKYVGLQYGVWIYEIVIKVAVDKSSYKFGVEEWLHWIVFIWTSSIQKIVLCHKLLP
jgi:hypothetical protein